MFVHVANLVKSAFPCRHLQICKQKMNHYKDVEMHRPQVRRKKSSLTLGKVLIVLGVLAAASVIGYVALRNMGYLGTRSGSTSQQIGPLSSQNLSLEVHIGAENEVDNEESIPEPYVSNDLLFSEDVNVLKIDLNASEFKVDHIATAPDKECSPQYSRDKKQIYFAGTNELKIYNLENGPVSDLILPDLYISGKFILLKPNLNELIYVSRHGDEFKIRYNNISNPSLTKHIGPYKCGKRKGVELLGQFSDGSKFLYKCGGTSKVIWLKDLKNTAVEDYPVAKFDTLMTRIVVCPDNRRIISCTQGNSYCTLFNIHDQFNLSSEKIPLPIEASRLNHFAFSKDQKTLYILGSNGMKENDDYKLIRLNYEQIVNNPRRASYQIGEVTRISKPENFINSTA